MAQPAPASLFAAFERRGEHRRRALLMHLDSAHHRIPSRYATCLRRQFIEQRFCVHEISRIQPFRKPTIHVTKQLPRLVSFALTLPESSEAGGGTEFPAFGALGLGKGDGLVETGFSFRIVV